ncbi:MAG: RtcB family protein [Patescibacteria group bacterium]
MRNQVKKYREKTEFFKIDPQSKTGRAYWTAHRAGANYGFANRTMITQNVKGALKKIFNKKVRLKTVCDLPHIFVERENITAGKYGCTVTELRGASVPEE